jgi:hypothetical protein
MEVFRVVNLIAVLSIAAALLQYRQAIGRGPRRFVSMSSVNEKNKIGRMLTTSDLSSSCPKEFDYASLGMPRM